MDSAGCLQRLREIYNTLNGAEKRVAEYILNDPQNIVQLSITELAEQSKSGEATIFRLCKKLGYKGYQELKIKIAGEVISPIENIHEEINEGDNALLIMQKVINSTISSLNETLKINDYRELEKAINIISSSRQVAFFGMGGSASVASDGYHKFLRSGKKCEYNSDSHFQAMIASIYDENDCIVAISSTGSNKELVENIKIARENGVKIIAITSNSKSPISKVSNVVLISYGIETSFKSEAMESRISALTLIDCLFVGVCLKNKDDYFKHLAKIRSAIAHKRY